MNIHISKTMFMNENKQNIKESLTMRLWYKVGILWLLMIGFLPYSATIEIPTSVLW